MNTRRETVRMDEEEMANVGANDNQVPPQDNKVPPLEEVAMGDRVPVVPPLMTDGEIRKHKIDAFINLHYGGMSVLDYSLKFTKLSKYASSFVLNPRDEMS